ncbi:glycosyltransferase family 2 protein [Afipia birgiae]|jgi:glycosyltransferase involved in cell wall biosynthesis|uniref:glycosyltransferase family 2 protein n=1 Tax=Afipia birgiae TaxID=151414 RepID=UPI000314DF02|nr:glycosyltransferase family 2 protein [Afipia birgiae]
MHRKIKEAGLEKHKQRAPMKNPYLTSTEATTDPLVTIAIPTFNRASWLGDCILAALAQTYPHFEVVVSDNASTDATSELLRGISDPKLRVLTQKSNIGQIPNWNACLAEAKGDYVVFVSDDDRIAPSLLERCIALVKREGQVQVVVALSDVYFAAQSVTWHAPHNRKLTTGIWDGADILEEYLEDRISAAMCSMMFSTEGLRTEGGFPVDFTFASDTIAWFSLILNGRAGLVNRSCATLCVHTANLTSTLDLETRLSCLRRLVDLISEKADHCIGNTQRRRDFQLTVRRYFARYAIGALASYRRDGADLSQVIPVMWQLRRYLRHIGLNDSKKIARFVVIIALPAALTRWTRGIVRMRFLTKLSPTSEPS